MIAIRHIGYLGLSWDHRAFDGSTAVLFLQRIKQNLETWDWAGTGVTPYPLARPAALHRGMGSAAPSTRARSSAGPGTTTVAARAPAGVHHRPQRGRLEPPGRPGGLRSRCTM